MDETTALEDLTLRILCKNAHIGDNVRKWQLLQELEAIQWDIICFSEARSRDEDILLTGEHRLITCLMEDIYAGVGILIHKRWCTHIISIGKISGRLMYVDIKVDVATFRFIAIYVPHAGYSNQEFHDCLLRCHVLHVLFSML